MIDECVIKRLNKESITQESKSAVYRNIQNNKSKSLVEIKRVNIRTDDFVCMGKLLLSIKKLLETN